MSANGLRQQNGAPTSSEDLFGVAQHPKSEKTHFRLDRSSDSHLSHPSDNPSRTEDLQGKMDAFHWRLLIWTVDDSLSFEAWEAPESEASEEEDDYQWLRQRGFRSPHEYWPSHYRQCVGSIVAKDCLLEGGEPVSLGRRLNIPGDNKLL